MGGWEAKTDIGPLHSQILEERRVEKIQAFLCGENLKGAIKFAHIKASPQADIEL